CAVGLEPARASARSAFLGKIYIGAALKTTPGAAYKARFRFAELALQSPLPRPSTMARWRSHAPHDFHFSLLVPREPVSSKSGPLRLDDRLERNLEWLRAARDALKVRALVVATHSSVTPGQRDRDLLARYFERLPQDHGCKIVWSPSGIWDPWDALNYA